MKYTDLYPEGPYYPAVFSIDGNTEESEVVQGYAAKDGSPNGWANPILQADELIRWAYPYTVEFLVQEDDTPLARVDFEGNIYELQGVPLPILDGETGIGTYEMGYQFFDPFDFVELARLPMKGV